MVVRPAYAPQFYSGDCRAQMEKFRECYRPVHLPEKIVAGVVPHAGWFFSGATAAKVFFGIKDTRTPRTFVLFGAVHMPGVRNNSIYSYGAWETPLGQIRVDELLAETLLDEMGDILEKNLHAHSYEHSIEVQAPMIKYLFPNAMILPIAVPPGEDAVELGGRLAKIIADQKKDAVVVGTTDLTHYGDNYGFTPAGYGEEAYRWMIKNDQRVIQLALNLDACKILVEAGRNHNACGPGALAATVSAAKVLGAEHGVLLEHTTSYEVYSEGEFDMAVGYAGIVF